MSMDTIEKNVISLIMQICVTQVTTEIALVWTKS